MSDPAPASPQDVPSPGSGSGPGSAASTPRVRASAAGPLVISANDPFAFSPPSMSSSSASSSPPRHRKKKGKKRDSKDKDKRKDKDVFTDSMRDRQARGMDPYAAGSADEADKNLRVQEERRQGVLRVQAHRQAVTMGMMQEMRLRRAPPPMPKFRGKGKARDDGEDGGDEGEGDHENENEEEDNDDKEAAVYGHPGFPAAGMIGFGPYWNTFEREDDDDVPENTTEDFALSEPRRHASIVLDSPELLMMYSLSTGVSIPAARLRFTRMMCGFPDDDDDDGKGKEILREACLPRRSGRLRGQPRRMMVASSSTDEY